MLLKGSLFIISFLRFPLVTCKTAEEWKTRVIYQILTDRFSHTDDNPDTACGNLRGYCGGTFKGIQNNLDYIQGLGANAIWISPMVLNTDLGYHGYWALNLYEINPEFGTRQDLLDLIQACHDRDIWVMLDVIANHMGVPTGCYKGDICNSTEIRSNFSEFVPFNGPEFYHPYCKIDWENTTKIENCWLGRLADLKQENPYVRQVLLDWIANTTRDYGFDGYRIDTVVEVPHEFWGDFQRAAGVFCIGEANMGRISSSQAASYQPYLNSLLNFPTYWALREIFNEGGPMLILPASLGEERHYFKDTSVLGSFLDNHDFQRFLNLTNNVTKLKNALTYVLLSEGIPIIYYGTEQAFRGGNDPDNRESLWPFLNTQSDMYQFVKGVTSVRSGGHVDFSSANQVENYVDMDVMAFSRIDADKKMLLIITSNGSSTTFSRKLTRFVGYQNGTEFENMNRDEKLTLKNNELEVTFHDGLPQIYRVKEPSCPTCATCPTASSAGQPLPVSLLMLCLFIFHMM